MKKFLFLFALLVGCLQARADEGMWLLQMIEEQHLADSLRKAGLKMPVGELYSETSPSLREVVGIFDGGCTGEIISRDGLVLTNNHCGFEKVHAMSTMEKNYLQDGFFAKSRAEEVPVPDLSFKFIVRIEDVTEAIMTYARREKVPLGELTDNALLERIGYRWLMDTKYADRPGMDARLYSFYSGNKYYMVYTQEYSDVRLVVNPPQNVAQFGGNSDNWVWPRHNPDFAIFRIYADKNGQPAEYEEENVPLKCAKWLPISLQGLKEGDYTMIMGFPGKTSRNLTEGQLKYLKDSFFPAITGPMEVQMEHLRRRMLASKEDNLALANKYFEIGNTTKNLEGQRTVIDREHLMEKARQRVLALEDWARKNGKTEYLNVAQRIDSVHKVYADSIHDLIISLQMIEMLNEGFANEIAEAFSDEDYFDDIVGILKRRDHENLAEALRETVSQTAATFRQNYGLYKQLFAYYFKNKRLPFNVLGVESEAEANALLAQVHKKSILTDSLRMEKFIKKPSIKALEAEKFPAFFSDMREKVRELDDVYDNLSKAKGDFVATFVKGLNEMNGWAKAPDANSTLRLTYGHVADLRSPKGTMYGYETTLEGMIAKESASDPDYALNPRMRELFEAKTFGRYARKDGKLPACFITTNDITGGNSGSPVLNDRGELIGCAFDGNIEGLGGDLEYNIALQRTIATDIRFILWVTDVFGGSRYVIDELDIR